MRVTGNEQREVDEIFSEAVLIDPTARSSFLDRRCANLGSKVRVEVEKLLEADQVPHKLSVTEANPHLNVSKFLPDVERCEEVGQQIGKYKLLEKIGEGGMGVVYMALQSRPAERRVALKVIKPGMDSKQVLARFEAERQALAMMDHPNIAKVFDVGATDAGRPYFVMELVKGIPITDYCEQKNLETNQRLAIFVSVCQAVAHAHQKGIIHRDIKPSNVLLAEYDDELVPKVIDFGVAKATTQKLTDRPAFTGFGQLIGTFEYMSPEQAKLNQLDVDTRTDVYSMGVLLYQLVTGTTPFDSQRLRAAALDEAIRIIAEEEPPKPSTRITKQSSKLSNDRAEPQPIARTVQSELDWIVMKALEKKRDRRYQTAKDFAEDVRRHLSGDSVEACPPTLIYRTRKFIRKYKTQTFATAAMLAFLAATSVIGWVQYHKVAQGLLVERSTRLAAQASALMGTQPVQSARFAIDAVETAKRTGGKHVPISHQMLGKAVLELGGTPLVGHRGGINSASFSSDGRWLVTGGGTHDGARLWDLSSPQKAFWLPHPNTNVWHAAISRDNRWIATGANHGSVRLWRLQADGPSQSFVELQGFKEPFITSFVISDDSRKLVAGGDDGAVLVWDLTVKDPNATRQIFLESSQRNAKTRVDISADGRWLVSGSNRETAFLWDLESDEPTVAKLTFELDEAISAIAISPDARWLVTGSESPRLWDLTSDEPIKSWQPLWQQNGVSSVAITDDGKKLAVAGADGTACLYDLSEKNPGASCLLVRGHDGYVRTVGISHNQRWLVTGGDDHKVRLWDLTSVEDQVLPTLPDDDGNTASIWSAETEFGVTHQLHGHDGWIDALAISLDSKQVATGDWVGNLRLWNLDTSNPAANRVVSKTGEVQALGVSPDGNWLAVGRDGPNSRLWRLDESGALRNSIDLRGAPDGIGSLEISSDSRWLVATSAVPAFRDAQNYKRNERVARVWDLQGPDPREPKLELRHSDSVRDIAISGNGRFAVTGSEDTTAKLWDLAIGDLVETFDCDGNPVSSVAVDFSGNLVAIGCHHGHAYLLDLASHPPVKHQLRGHTRIILKIAISPNGRWVATGNENRPRVWDLKSTKPWESRIIPGHKYYTTSVAFSRDSQWLATGSWSKATNVWNLSADDPFATPYASHESKDIVHSLSFSFDSRRLLTGSNGVARLLDLTSPGSIVTLPICGSSLALTPQGRYAIAGQGRNVQLSSTSIKDELSYAKRLIGEELPPE